MTDDETASIYRLLKSVQIHPDGCWLAKDADEEDDLRRRLFTEFYGRPDTAERVQPTCERGACVSPLHAETALPNHRKLSDAEIEEIRERWQTEPGLTGRKLAEEYGVTHSTIYRRVEDLKRPARKPREPATG